MGVTARARPRSRGWTRTRWAAHGTVTSSSMRRRAIGFINLVA